jgi:catechol 2,3-dioxygenase-like lactoylglutathione lyase family enzyme
MKTHLNFATADLQKSVAFYSTLLQTAPAKHLADYALSSTDEVDRAIERLQAAGLQTRVEREETCCYANQTKVWAQDPDGRRWEVYTVHEETSARDDENTSCCTTDAEQACCAA